MKHYIKKDSGLFLHSASKSIIVKEKYNRPWRADFGGMMTIQFPSKTLVCDVPGNNMSFFSKLSLSLTVI